MQKRNKIPGACVTFAVTITIVIALNIMTNKSVNAFNIFTGATIAAISWLAILYTALQSKPDESSYFRFCIAITITSITIAATCAMTGTISIETALYFACQNSGIIFAAIFMLCTNKFEKKVRPWP